MTDPTTQASEALLDDIGQLVRTIRIAAKVPDSEIVPGATRQQFLERIAAIEAEARADSAAQIAALCTWLIEQSNLAWEAVDKEPPDKKPWHRGYRHAVDATLTWIGDNLPAAAQEWEQRTFEAGRQRGIVDGLDAVRNGSRAEIVNDWLASPDAEKWLYDALPHGLEGRRAIAQHTLHAMLAVSKIEQQAAMQGEGGNK